MIKKIIKESILNPPINPKISESNVNFKMRRSFMDIDIMSSQEVMKALKISEVTLHGLVKQKEIPHFYIGKKCLRFRKEAIIAWLASLEEKVSKGAA
jgi:predicted DNA-binding transcriptional regulator AlpA